MIKPLLLNTSDYGGAATSCLRLHRGLLDSGVDSNILFARRKSQISIPFSDAVHTDATPTVQKAHKRNIREKIHREIQRIGRQLGVKDKATSNRNWPSPEQTAFLNSRPRGLEMYSFPYSACDITKTSAYQAANIINFHWVSDFLDWESFFRINKKPVVWTLHDQNPFLGGEHYAERFLGMNSEGVPLPRSYSDRELQMDKMLLDFKKSALRNVENLYIVTPSRWLMEISQQSEIFSRFPHHHIPYGYPTGTFKPHERFRAREKLNIPQNKMVFLYVSDTLENNRKGYAIFKEAVKKLTREHQDNLLFCAIGENAKASYTDAVMELGRINDEETMALAYSATDAFIIPSLEDNLPNTMIESILCGTPVIGFNTGGIPEAIINGENGYICTDFSVNGIVGSMDRFLINRNTFDRDSIAKNAKSKYHSKVQGEKYRGLYEQILSQPTIDAIDV